MSNYERTKRLCVVAALSAAAVVSVLLLRINVQFLTLDFKQVFLTVISFLYGPVYGIVSAAAVCLIEFATVSSTGFYGLIMNLAASVTFCGIAGLVYRKKRVLSGAVTGLAAGVLVMTAAMLIANLFVTPVYMNTTRQAVVDLMLPLLIPFNLLKGILNSAFILLLYKPVSNAVKRLGNNMTEPANTRKGFVSVIVIVAALLIACGATLAILLGMGGSFQIF